MPPRRILFVCMGNICRSPAAEGVFRALVERRGLSAEFAIDSAGTTGYHAGELPDLRMRKAAERRGIVLDHPARQVVVRDFDKFDLVLAMDRDNLFHLHTMDRDGKHREKIKLMTEYSSKPGVHAVPDPYYGPEGGFDLVLDLLEDSCAGLLAELAPEATP